MGEQEQGPKAYDQDLDLRDFLVYLQEESQKWREKCFPAEHRTAPLQALGVCEEAGELAHAVLKMEQGIRGSEEEHRAAAADAVGDIVIYLAGLCTSLNLDLHRCISAAWWQVATRDWSKYKETGRADRTEGTEQGLDPFGLGDEDVPTIRE